MSLTIPEPYSTSSKPMGMDGVPINVSEFTNPGTLITSTRGVIIHPLDYITLTTTGPLDRLDKAMRWFLERANEKFAKAIPKEY